MSGQNTFDTSRSLRNIQRMIALLAEKPMTRPQLSAALFMSRPATFRYLHHLRAADNKRIYVKGFLRTQGCRAPIYALGSKPDAIEPPRDSRIVRRQRERASLLADVDRLDRHRAKKAIIKKIARARSKPQSWLSALGVTA